MSPWGYLDVNTDVYGDQRLRIPKSWSYTGCNDMDSELSFHPSPPLPPPVKGNFLKRAT